MASQGISRRTALAAGLGAGALGAVAAGGYGLVESGTLPGKYRLARLLGTCGTPPPPAGPGPSRHEAQFQSAYRRRRVTTVTLLPAGVRSPRGLGVVVALRGLGGNAIGTAGALALAALPRPWPASSPCSRSTAAGRTGIAAPTATTRRE